METVSGAIARSLGTHVRLSLTADGGRLHIVVPKGHASPALRAAFGQRKNAILDVLHGWPDGACFACGKTLCCFSWDECLSCAHCHPRMVTDCYGLGLDHAAPGPSGITETPSGHASVHERAAAY